MTLQAGVPMALPLGMVDGTSFDAVMEAVGTDASGETIPRE
jgi:hypothetical protein